MGQVETKIHDHTNHDQTHHPDPLSGLTKNDITNIRRSWAPMWAKADVVGQDLVKRMFNSEGCTKNMMKNFQKMDEAALHECDLYRGYVINFMSDMNTLITHLEDSKVAASILQTLGVLHTKDKPHVQYFDIVDKEMLEFLKEEHKLNEAIIESWKRFLAFVHPHIDK